MRPTLHESPETTTSDSSVSPPKYCVRPSVVSFIDTMEVSEGSDSSDEHTISEVTPHMTLDSILKEEPTTHRENNRIIKATENALLNEICTSTTEFMQTFMWTHTMFMSSPDMVLGLTTRFTKACEESTKKSLEVQVRIMNALRYVLLECWSAISNKNEVRDIILSFCETLSISGKVKQAELLKTNLNKRLEGKEILYVESVKELRPPIPPFSEVLNVQKEINIFDISPLEFARQMTLMIHSAFCKIKLYEFFKWTNEKVGCKSLNTLVMFYNNFQKYFQVLILTAQSKQARNDVVKYLVNVAHFCLDMRNYDVMVCIMQIFTTACMFRLKNMFEAMSTETKTRYDEMVKISSPTNNWANLRILISKDVDNPRVPYLGITLKDMTFIAEGHTTRTDDGLVNFEKCRMMCKIVRMFDETNIKGFNFKVENNIRWFIEHLKDDMDESTMLELSSEIENSSLISVKFEHNGEIESVECDKRSIIEDVFGTGIGILMNKGLLENRVLDMKSPVTELKVEFGDSFLAMYKGLNKVPFVFRYDTQNVLLSLAVDVTWGFYETIPIIQSYMMEPIGFLPLVIDENYRVTGILNIEERIDETLDGGLGFYLLPLDYFNARRSKLEDDLHRYQYAPIFCQYDFKNQNESIVVLLIDHFIAMYKDGFCFRLFPIDFVRFNIVSKTKAFYFEKIPGMKYKSPYSIDTPLELSGETEELITLAQKLQKQSGMHERTLIGIHPSLTHLERGIPLLVIDLIKSIYTDENFVTEGSLFNVPIENDLKIVDMFNTNTIIGSFKEKVGILKLFLECSCTPFFLHLDNIDFSTFSSLTPDLKMKKMRDWTVKVHPSMTGIFVVLMKVFATYNALYPQTDFKEWAFCISSDVKASEILNFIVKNSDLLNDVKVTSQYSLPIVCYDKKTYVFTQDDFTFFNDEVHYALNTPTSILNYFTKKNVQINTICGETNSLVGKTEEKKMLIGSKHVEDESTIRQTMTPQPSCKPLTFGVLTEDSKKLILGTSEERYGNLSPRLKPPRKSDPNKHTKSPISFHFIPFSPIFGRLSGKGKENGRKSGSTPRESGFHEEQKIIPLESLKECSGENPDILEETRGLPGLGKIEAKDSPALRRKNEEKEKKRRNVGFANFTYQDVILQGNK
ncbi:guanine nucleotide exchange factor, putative [Entamoeba invadens IP1]|uniref:Guanine nucleotide exchange factor, putative n=1 Tax=Entamoeba invadens IP1 TaxID=370355 RepID=A0A0A1U8W1_ENTIV|nr:guanine nucleotide exchange factor, putative [Entamoeba invadens IP1]ELP91355.1 guanine nucleotide exchange factor, putative [Entamoeba invadens IP1]|eukprot:XP_004258126.1 guanine nucleotide exchange factor, putative [Entamoeba invadens IP1]